MFLLTAYSNILMRWRDDSEGARCERIRSWTSIGSDRNVVSSISEGGESLRTSGLVRKSSCDEVDVRCNITLEYLSKSRAWALTCPFMTIFRVRVYLRVLSNSLMPQPLPGSTTFSAAKCRKSTTGNASSSSSLGLLSSSSSPAIKSFAYSPSVSKVQQL